MFSIDQNCHSLWDVIPKLHAIRASGHHVRHFIEDVDIAFTSLGAIPGRDGLRLARERFHHSGGADWGAAMFYSEFLGRLPVEVRRWEQFTGLASDVLARRLNRTVDSLYEEFSPSDNWQLVGSSYVGDSQHHRTIADLTVAETAPFLLELLDKARANMHSAFPQQAARQRLREWFATERRSLEEMIARASGGRLVDVYHAWLRQYVGESVGIDFLSSMLAARDGSAGSQLLAMFCSRYEQTAELYNQALAETASDLAPLDTRTGALPFFVTLGRDGRRLRCDVSLEGRRLRIADREFLLADDGRCSSDDLKAAGVDCLGGKALLLVIQVRMGEQGKPLALPYRGSLYMPTARSLEAKLIASGLLGGKLEPIVRVRLRLLDRLKEIDTVISLPEHLRGYFGADEIPAMRLGQEYQAIASAAADRLESLRSPPGRQAWQEANFPATVRQIAELDARRRQLAASAPKSPELRDLWKRVKARATELLDLTLRQIARDWQARDIDYWDSRGAILPWCIALGGLEFYNQVVARAEVYSEPPVSP